MAVASAACWPALVLTWEKVTGNICISATAQLSVHTVLVYTACSVYACCAACMHARFGLAFPVALAICQPSRNLPRSMHSKQHVVQRCSGTLPQHPMKHLHGTLELSQLCAACLICMQLPGKSAGLLLLACAVMLP
jgi:hypothetical protein